MEPPDRRDDAGSEELDAFLGGLLTEIGPLENGEAERRRVGSGAGQEVGDGGHLAFPGDIICGLTHHRAGVDGGPLIDEDTGGIGPAVPGRVVERGPAEPVRAAGFEAHLEKAPGDPCRPSGGRVVKERRRGFQDRSALTALGQS